MLIQDENQGLASPPLSILENVNPDTDRHEQYPKRVWTTLITNTAYLPGLLTLAYSLVRVGSRYPLIALYTDTFPPEGHAALDARGILKKRIPYLLPSVHKDYSNDVRFYDCWSKLAPFGLAEYDRVVQLDSDMLVLKNMDELMEMELDDSMLGGKGERVFAATHACVCNPLNKKHYPKDWIPANCAYTTQHSNADLAQVIGAPPSAGLGIPNGGLQVVNPSKSTYAQILSRLQSPDTMSYDFADQSLLADCFPDRWFSLPYVYNALKTMRWDGVHDAIWRDEEIRNVHYILSPKPWEETEKDIKYRTKKEEINAWWWKINDERLEVERKRFGKRLDEF